MFGFHFFGDDCVRCVRSEIEIGLVDGFGDCWKFDSGLCSAVGPTDKQTGCLVDKF